jgi:lipopolysaccharide export system permease protein
VAEEGIIETAKNGDRFVVLLNGRRYDGEPGMADYRVMQFERYSVRMEPKEVGELQLSSQLMPTLDLLEKPTAAGRGELVWRIGLPIATVLLAMLAIPLSFVNPRAGRTNSLIFAVLTFTIYLNLLGVSRAWVAQGKLGAVQGTWGVHGLMLILLGVLFIVRLAPSVRRS